MTKPSELKYVIWIDDTYQELLKRIQGEHQKFCIKQGMSEDAIAQAMIKNRWETLSSLKELVDKDLKELNF